MSQRVFLDEVNVPVIAAPMAGGLSTPALVAAVGEAGGFGFLAAGYLSPNALTEKIAATRELTGKSFGVNLFVPGVESTVDTTGYVDRLEREAQRYGVRLGDTEWDDDDYAAKLDAVVAERITVVSFTFGLPSRSDVERLREAGSTIVVTVTSPAEARLATEIGADVLCVQGFEAGGHRSIFADDSTNPAGAETYGLLALLRLVSMDPETGKLPLIAAGGIMHGADVAAVLTAGASAAQLGTAFLRADEAGTPHTQRRVLAEGDRSTQFTRAFSGRPARGLVNDFLTEHTLYAPSAYPQLHRLSKPIRAAASRSDDPESMSLWAGQTYSIGKAGPAAEIITRLWGEATTALSRGDRWLSDS